MAKQHSIFKVNGTLDDVTFYKGRTGYFLRRKGGISADRIASDPGFQRTRENGSEFGRAGNSLKLLRRAFKPLITNLADSASSNRLMTLLMRVIKTDAVSDRGSRTVANGDMALMLDFQFNKQRSLSDTFRQVTATQIIRETGVVTISIPACTAVNDVFAPPEASFFKFVAAAAVLDFNTGSFEVFHTESAEFAIQAILQPAFSLSGTLTGMANLPVVAVLGIEFYQQVNARKYLLQNFNHHALNITGVSTVV